MSIFKYLLFTLSLLITSAHMSLAGTTLGAPQEVCNNSPFTIVYSAVDANSCWPIRPSSPAYLPNENVNALVDGSTNGSFTETYLGIPVTYTFSCFNSLNVEGSSSVQITTKSPLDPSCITVPGVPNVSFDVSPQAGTWPVQVGYNLSQTGAASCEIISSAEGIFHPSNMAAGGVISLSNNPPATGIITVTAQCWSGANKGGTPSALITKQINITCPAGKQWSSGANKCVWSGSPTASLTLNKLTAEQDESFNIAFSSTNADTCTLSLDGTVVMSQTSANFDTSLQALGNHTYLLTCNAVTINGPEVGSDSKTINITPRLYPNLVADNLDLPQVLSAGANTPLTARVRNTGQASTGGSFVNLFVITTAFDGGGTRTELRTPIHAPMAINALDTIGSSYIFPAAGQYSVVFCTDKGTYSDVIGDITETDVDNCTPFQNYTVGPALTGIDLTTTSLTFDPSIEALTPVVFTLNFQNIGTNSTIAGFPNLLKYSMQADGSSPTLATVDSVANPYIGPLAAGAPDNTLLTYTFPTDGLYFVSACVDQDINGASTVSEDAPNEDNNCTAWIPANVSPAATVDLLGVSHTKPATIRAETAAAVSFKIRNIGSTPAPANFANVFKYSTFSDGSSATKVSMTSPATPLNPNGEIDVTANVTFPAANTYYISACADENMLGAGSVQEMLNDNNCTALEAVVVDNPYPPITITIKDIVAVPISTNLAVPTTAKLTWQSNVDTCEVWDKQTTAVKIGNAIRSGVSPNYNYTFTLSSHAPQSRTELNSTHLGAGALGYDIKCNDSTLPARGTFVKIAEVETYFKTIPSFTQINNGDVVAKCTPDFDYVLLQRNNVTVTGYPKVFATNQISPFTSQFTPVANSTYVLTCKSRDYNANASIEIFPGGASSNSLSVTASLSSGSNFDSKTVQALEETLSVVSNTGDLTSLFAQIMNFDSWDIKFYNQYYLNAPVGAATYEGTSVNNNNLPLELRPVGGVINASTISNITSFPLGFTLKLSATKGGTTKVLWIKLKTEITPTAYLSHTPSPTALQPNQVDITIRCKDATSYELHHTNVGSANPVIFSQASPIPMGLYTNTVVYDLNNQESGTIANIELRCINGANTGKITKNIPISDRAPAEIKSLNALPLELTCPGGNNEVNLNWAIGNTYAKACRIRAEAINNPLADPAITEQIDQINSNMLNANLYISTANGISAPSDMSSTLEKRDTNGDSRAKLQLKYQNVVTKDSLPVSGNRLFFYSTRFIVECDARNPNPAAQNWNPLSSTYSRKSVDVIARCTTQN